MAGSFSERARNAPSTLFTPSGVRGPSAFEKRQKQRQEREGLKSPAEVAESAEQSAKGLAGSIGPEEVVLGAEIAASIPGGGIGSAIIRAIGRPILRRVLRRSAISTVLGPPVQKAAEVTARIPGSAAAAVGAGEAATALVNPGETPEDAASRRKLAAGGAAAGEALAPAVSKVISPLTRRITRPRVIRDLEPGVEAAQRRLAPTGRSLTPDQAAEEGLVDIAGNFARSSFLGFPVMRRSIKQTTQAAEKLMDDFVAGFQTQASRVQEGQLLRNVLEEGSILHRGTTRSAWRKADRTMNRQSFRKTVEEARTETVVTDFVDSRGNPLTYERLTIASREQIVNPVVFGRIKPIARKQLGSRIRAGDESASRILKIIEDQPDLMTLSEANDVRSVLLEIARSDATLVPGTKALANRYAGLILGRINVVGRRLTGRALEDYNLARDLTRLGKEVYNDGYITALLRKKSPEEIYQSVFLTPQRPSSIRKVREIVFKDAEKNVAIPGGDPREFWEGVQGQWMIDMLARARGGAAKDYGERLVRSIDNFGDESLKELFPDSQVLDNYRELAKTIELAQSEATGQKIGGMAIQLTQTRLIPELAIGLATFGATGSIGAGAVLAIGGPLMIAKAFSNNAISRAIIATAKSSRLPTSGRFTSQTLTQAARHLIKLLDKAGIEYEIRDEVE